ncbi:MAG: hypothetical protein RMJ87_02495 [Cytophagales bacterium]|nr:hypothetical protein [Cytophagales bacterium]
MWANFNKNLFQALSPPFPPVRLLRFDGSLKDDEVHLQLDFFVFKQMWISKISEQETTPEQISFVDEGIQLPFFLSYWRHKHVLQALPNGGTRISDEVTFKSSIKMIEYVLFPVLYLQFLYRKPIYKRYFQ